jgi:hypothetical protein
VAPHDVVVDIGSRDGRDRMTRLTRASRVQARGAGCCHSFVAVGRFAAPAAHGDYGRPGERRRHRPSSIMSAVFQQPSPGIEEVARLRVPHWVELNRV